MVHVITSNGLEVRSLKEPVENFMIVHEYRTPIHGGSTPMHRDCFDVYMPMKISIDDALEEQMEEYIQNCAEIHIARTPIDAIEKIFQRVMVLAKTDEDDDAIIIAGHPNFSKLVSSHLNRLVKNSDDPELDIGILNLIQHLGVTKFDRMVEQIRAMTRLTEVYPDDPIAFAFVVHRALLGG